VKPIEGVIVDSCRRFDNDRGYLQEIWRDDEDGASHVRQIYTTCTREGVVKAWYKHAKQVDTFFVLEGQMRLLLVDDRPDAVSRGAVEEFLLSAAEPRLLTLPPGIWHGFRSLSGNLVVLHANSRPYRFEEPDEMRLVLDSPGMPSWELT
jgi:dTDP-4-dehydrorhamnose 3,5-epimerase